MNIPHVSAPRRSRVSLPTLARFLFAFGFALAGTSSWSANTAANTTVSLQASINQLEAQIQAAGSITQAQQDQLDSLLAQLETARKASNDALYELDQLINNANNLAGGTIIQDPNLDPVDPNHIAAVRDALDNGNPGRAVQIIMENRDAILRQLADPAKAQVLADPRFLPTGGADAARYAQALAALANQLPTAPGNTAAQSANVLAAAALSIVGNGQVQSAAPAAAGMAAQAAVAALNKPGVTAADPAAAARAANLALQVAGAPGVDPNVAVAIRTSAATLLPGTPSGPADLLQTTNQSFTPQPLDPTIISRSS